MQIDNIHSYPIDLVRNKQWYLCKPNLEHSSKYMTAYIWLTILLLKVTQMSEKLKYNNRVLLKYKYNQNISKKLVNLNKFLI